MKPVFIEFEVTGMGKDYALKIETKRKSFLVSEIMGIDEFEEDTTAIQVKAGHHIKSFQVTGSYEQIRDRITEAANA